MVGSRPTKKQKEKFKATENKYNKYCTYLQLTAKS